MGGAAHRAACGCHDCRVRPHDGRRAGAAHGHRAVARPEPRRRHEGAENVRSARRPRRVPVVRVRRPFGTGARDRRAVDAPAEDDRGVHAGTVAGLRLRRGLVGGGARRRRERREHRTRPARERRRSPRAEGTAPLGRLAPSGDERDQRQVRRPVALHQRSCARPHRHGGSVGFPREADPAGAESPNLARRRVRDAEHRIRPYLVQGPRAESREPGTRADRHARGSPEQVRGSVPRLLHLREDRPEDRPDGPRKELPD